MKSKTSISLSTEVLESIDRYSNEFRSRSDFLEQAARIFLARLARVECERRDLEIINRSADSLNAEAADVLAYQVPQGSRGSW
jgi:metal-responsive CopG/Arc/MetJ family transcriptional regulator